MLFGFEYKRACDFFIGPIDLKSIKAMESLKAPDYDVERLITDLEGGRRTVCIKTASTGRQSRSAALLYRGRVVGCTYSNKRGPGYLSTENALVSLLDDLNGRDTDVIIYDLPEEVVASLASLFIGNVLDRDDSMGAGEYYEHMMDWFADNKTTACLTIVTGHPPRTNLVIVHKGQLIGPANTRIVKQIVTSFTLTDFIPCSCPGLILSLIHI